MSNFTFDGYGVNDADNEYRRRVATLSADYKKREIGNLLAAAPDLLSAAVEAEQALADIVGAAHNGEPYTAQELAGFAAEAASKLYAAIAKARGE